MSHLKDYVKATSDVMHFLTYADNYAIGYFKKQGFTKEITLDKPKWMGYIKDYEGGTIMQCSMLPKIRYLESGRLLLKQKAAVHAKIRSVSKSYEIHQPPQHGESAKPARSCLLSILYPLKLSKRPDGLNLWTNLQDNLGATLHIHYYYNYSAHFKTVVPHGPSCNPSTATKYTTTTTSSKNPWICQLWSRNSKKTNTRTSRTSSRTSYCWCGTANDTTRKRLHMPKLRISSRRRCGRRSARCLSGAISSQRISRARIDRMARSHHRRRHREISKADCLRSSKVILSRRCLDAL